MIIGIIFGLYMISIILSLIVYFFALNIDMNWSVGDKISMFFILFIPILNLTTIFYGSPLIIDYFKNRKHKATEKEVSVFLTLDKMDIKVIERYLRVKKLKKLK